jgi:hypothetical protein
MWYSVPRPERALGPGRQRIRSLIKKAKASTFGCAAPKPFGLISVWAQVTRPKEPRPRLINRPAAHRLKPEMSFEL